jgi:crotonobetaine/carnitine-CoA ligase
MSAHDFSDYTLRNFLEHAVEANPNDPFLIWEEQVVSYVDFNFHVDQAAALWYSLGVRHGDCVSFMVDNSPEFLYAWLGLAKIGGVLVAINTGFKAKEAAYLVDHSQSEFALVGQEHMAVFDKVVQDVPRLKKVLTLGNVDGYDEFMASKESMPAKVPDVTVVGDDLISLIYTSGTTGLPKAVMQSHKNYVLTGQAYAHWMGMEKGDRIYACLPLFHINSQAYSTMRLVLREHLFSPPASVRRSSGQTSNDTASLFSISSAR